MTALLVLGLGGVSLSADAQGTFYDPTPSSVAQGEPGTMIRYEPMAGAPEGAKAWRILYRSSGLHDETIPVSGVVIVPSSLPPPGGRPVVAWAHPTTGVVPRCAPSLALSLFQDIPGLHDMLAAGAMVVATDYPGLGTRGPHPYLVGRSEGRAVLDAVRASWHVPNAMPGRRLAIWGHSQGGQAALFAGQLVAQYAPELILSGVAVAAPATQLEALMQRDANTVGGRNITAMTLWSWSRVFGVPMQSVLEPVAEPVVDALADECIESAFDLVRRQIIGRTLATHFLRVGDLAQAEPWRTLLAHNTAGPLPPAVPLFIVQGEADTLVEPDITREYARRQCAAGGAVRLDLLPGVGHGFVARDGAAQAVAWMMDRLSGRAKAPSDCDARASQTAWAQAKT